MGVEAPKTCWATHKRQVINLWNCCIWLFNLFELYDDARTWQRQTSLSPYFSGLRFSFFFSYFLSCTNISTSSCPSVRHKRGGGGGGGTLVCNTTPQDGRFRSRFPVGSLDIFKKSVPSNRNEYWGISKGDKVLPARRTDNSAVLVVRNVRLTLILLTWKIWWAPNNASRWQIGFNSAFKGLRTEAPNFRFPFEFQ
jgi:hypothetical protein